MGSPECACPSLAALLSIPGTKVVAVVAQPDRPKGRGLHLLPCAVKAFALERGLPVITPFKVNLPETVEALDRLRPDVIVVTAFGQILRKALLEMAPLGCVNVHASLLPKYRGAAPAQWAIARGESVTGVTTMLMNEGLDTGDMLLKREIPISPEDTGASLLMKLGLAGAELLAPTLEGLRSGTLRGEPQDERLATHAPKLNKASGCLDWTKPAAELERRVRAFNPWPCCVCEAPAGSGHALRVLRARVEPGTGEPGLLLRLDGEGPLVATGAAALRLLDVQPAGKKAMSGADYARGSHVKPGGRFGSMAASEGGGHGGC
ncbi:MAG: methionyl-tRNA formyltransferase [Kiritimatiellia bacterium]